MLHNKKILAIIPARGGSKGVKRKNVRLLGGKPLIAWTIEEALKSEYIDRLVLSSDDEEIIQCALNYGCEVPFVRPIELAKDTTPGIDVVLHALNSIKEYDYVVLLQPTSPFRSVDDIDNCIYDCIKNEVDALVSVVEVDKPPHWMYRLDGQSKLHPLLEENNNYSRRQDIPTTYSLNGAVYVANVNWLVLNKSFLGEETKGYVMPKERSVDIDSEFDFLYCETFLKTINKIDNE
ncbi:acylneuraminate cytidylyltransferase family protein [Bacillus sp. RG28]|uniref:Acylneuraminate cytidylyltransferase family protein n=1 Tax=Gottfriedia endophytica TaxID=2820819 RepID=A0A940NSH5_9BACI|nr:acylneuraminate cytidylyltransferase family protein [Gottfriedia endophytica]MBP0726728.1 acylneuraminate cytidylyltransferase family protein [Gottfriedia endophytica]